MPYADPLIRKQKAKEYSKAHYLRNREKVLAKTAEWGRNHPEMRLAYVKRWQSKNRPKIRSTRKFWRERNHDALTVKKRAQYQAQKAVKSGLLIRGDCQTCGANKNIHGHHEDYSKPLDVIWLCPPCHRRLHASRKG